MSEKKRDNINLLKLLIFGGILGFLLATAYTFIDIPTFNFDIVIEYSLYIQIAVILIFFLPTLFWIRKAKQHFSQIDETIDADDDSDREKAEQMLFRGLLFNRLFYVLSFISLGIAYDFNNPYFNLSMVIFLVALFPGVMNEVKIVRLIQANDPMKKGDPTSFKFNKDYFSSLDEGEKIQVYQAIYHTFKFMEFALIGFFVLSVFLSFYSDLGNGPMLMVGLIWLIQSVVYFYYSKKFSQSKAFV